MEKDFSGDKILLLSNGCRQEERTFEEKETRTFVGWKKVLKSQENKLLTVVHVFDSKNIMMEELEQSYTFETIGIFRTRKSRKMWTERKKNESKQSLPFDLKYKLIH